MADLELRFLGDFAVRRDGKPLPLPPSKKTRALLAYLSLNPRRFRREYLCELLWEIPDDPRGSLRWSLSKLRRLIDDDSQSRIVADRTTVAVNTEDVDIDVSSLRELVTKRLEAAADDELEVAAARYRGNFLEGLEFSNFHDFHTWCVAEREQVLRDRIALLADLVRRFEADPGRALKYARALVGLAPYEERLRAALIRLLNEAGQHSEAEEQYQLGLRMLREVGAVPSGLLQAARRAPRIDRPPPAECKVHPEPVAPPTVSAGSELVGRAQEFADIAGRFRDCVATSRAQVLLVRGAPGIGKSTVLDALLRQLDEAGAWVLSAAAFEADAIRPFAIWIDALRARDPAAHDAVFAGTDFANRDRMFAGLSDLLAQEAARRPVVIAFDDVHWCDESSAAALHYVCRMLRDRPVFCILAARTGELRDNAPMQQSLRGLRRDGLFHELRLGPLSEEEVTRLIALRSPDADCSKLGRESAGNPLLAIELARARGDDSVGSTLTDLVRERAARMDTVSAEVIGWAALLRPRIDIATLARLTELDAARVAEVLEAAERYAILVPGDRGLKFSHELVARAVYTEISPLRRQVMHRRVAEMLEKDAALDLARAADLAHHATQSGDPGLAARAMASAGRLCLRFFANEEAASLARKGLQFAEDLAEAERVCAEIDLHDVLLAAEPLADEEAAAEHYTALAEQALDHGQLKHARLGYQMAATVRWSQGQWAAARDQSLQAERAVRGSEDTAHIIGMAETAKCLVLLERDLSQADAMLMEARSLAERGRVVHQSVPLALGMLRYHENRLEEAEELFQQARTLCKSAGDRHCEFQVLEYLVMIDVQRGRWAQAGERCEQLVGLGEKLREGSERPFAHALRGLCAYALDDADAELDAAIEELRVVDAKYRLAYTLTRAALVDCGRGRKESAEERAGEALEYARILERPTEMLIAHAILACSCRERAEAAQAAEHEGEVVRLRPGAAGWTEEITARLAAKR